MSRFNVLAFENLSDDAIETSIDIPVENLEEQIEVDAVETSIEFQNLSRSIASLESLTTLVETYRSKDHVSMEDIGQLKVAMGLALAGSGVSVNKAFPALESVTDPKLALESVQNQIQEKTRSLSQRLLAGVRGLVDSVQYHVTLFDNYRSNLKALRGRLRQLREQGVKSKVTVTVPPSLYMRYGKNDQLVESKEDYFKQLEEMTSVLQTVLVSGGRFASQDFLSTIKTLLTIVIGSDRRFRTMFYNLERLMKDINSLPEMQRSSDKSNGEIEVHVSKPLLGMFTVKTSFADPTTYDKTNIESMRLTVSHFSDWFNISIIRDKKFRKDQSSLTVELKDLSLDDIEHLLNDAERLIEAYKSFGGVIKRLSSLGTAVMAGEFAVSATIPILFILQILLSNYRLMLQSSMIIVGLSSGAFSLARGHSKKLMQIADDALTMLERSAR